MLAWRRSALNRPVVVNLKTEKAFSGTIVAKRGRLLVIKGASILEPGRDPVAVDGDVIVSLENVDFVQVRG